MTGAGGSTARPHSSQIESPRLPQLRSGRLFLTTCGVDSRRPPNLASPVFRRTEVARRSRYRQSDLSIGRVESEMPATALCTPSSLQEPLRPVIYRLVLRQAHVLLHDDHYAPSVNRDSGKRKTNLSFHPPPPLAKGRGMRLTPATPAGALSAPVAPPQHNAC